jgi:hypothetical protein
VDLPFAYNDLRGSDYPVVEFVPLLSFLYDYAIFAFGTHYSLMETGVKGLANCPYLGNALSP